VVIRQLQVERRTAKVRRSKTDVLPLCHATNMYKRKTRWLHQLSSGKLSTIQD